MGIISGLFKSRDKPTDRTARSSYSFFLGGTASGKYVTERSAMQMTAVYYCVRILSEAVASLPLPLVVTFNLPSLTYLVNVGLVI